MSLRSGADCCSHQLGGACLACSGQSGREVSGGQAGNLSPIQMQKEISAGRCEAGRMDGNVEEPRGGEAGAQHSSGKKKMKSLVGRR